MRRSRGEEFDAFFFRSHDGFEADLILDHGRGREVIEIKLTSGPTQEDLGRLGKVSRTVGGRHDKYRCVASANRSPAARAGSPGWRITSGPPPRDVRRSAFSGLSRGGGTEVNLRQERDAVYPEHPESTVLRNFQVGLRRRL